MNKLDNNYIWRAMRMEDIPDALMILKTYSSQITEEELGILNQMPDDDLATDTLIALTPSGEVVAVGFVVLFQSDEKAMTGLLDGAVRTAHCRQGLGSHLLSWQMTRAQQIAGDVPFTLRGSCIADNTGCIHLFEEHGFAVLITQCKLRFDLNQPIPSRNLPDGVTITPFLSEHDNKMYQVFNQAFVGHWIGELSPDEWRERFISTPQFRPELTKLALINGQVIGFYLSEVFEKDLKQAWLEIVGVLPEYRGKGLGTALTAHALHSYKKAGFDSCWLGVDDENITNAKRIYVNLGFVQEKATRYFVKKEKYNSHTISRQKTMGSLK